MDLILAILLRWKKPAWTSLVALLIEMQNRKKHTLKFFDTAITCIEKRELNKRRLQWDWDGWLEFHLINVQVAQNIHYGGVGVMEENMDCSSSCQCGLIKGVQPILFLLFCTVSSSACAEYT